MSNSSFKKKDITQGLSLNMGFSKNFSKKIVDDLIEILKHAVIEKGNLNLKNLGSFKIITKKERIGRNPKTKEKFIITSGKFKVLSSKNLLKSLNKFMTKLYNISELSKILNLIDPKTKKPQNHILRYWEKEFREIKPKKLIIEDITH